MWWRKPKPDLLPETHDAQHDLALTESLIQQLASQDEEVESLVSNLEARRVRNNFGDSLIIAMERRTT